MPLQKKIRTEIVGFISCYCTCYVVTILLQSHSHPTTVNNLSRIASQNATPIGQIVIQVQRQIGTTLLYKRQCPKLRTAMQSVNSKVFPVQHISTILKSIKYHRAPSQLCIKTDHIVTFSSFINRPPNQQFMISQIHNSFFKFSLYKILIQ